MNTIKSQFYINIPGKSSVISLLKSYLDVNFEVIKKADNSTYGNVNEIRLYNLAPIALFSNSKLTTSSGKHLEDISHAHIVSSMYKLITSSKGSDDLYIGSDRSRNRRDELAQNKNLKGKYHLGFMFKDVIGYIEWMEKATNGLGYKLTIRRNNDEAVIDKAPGFADARIKNDIIHW